MTSFVPFRILLALTLVPAAAAVHIEEVGRCDNGNPSMGTFTLSDGSPERTFYVDDRGWNANGIWVYQESNGIRGDAEEPWHGLQRGGTSLTTGEREPCQSVGVPPDLLLF